MNEELAKAYYEYLDGAVIFRINITDTITEITGHPPSWIHFMDYNFLFGIDKTRKLSDENIKEIERCTGAVLNSSSPDYQFEYIENPSEGE